MNRIMYKDHSFDMVSVAYESTIDWKTRLTNEIPMLLKQLDRTEGKRVLDLACGTGRHAIALAQAGATVVGVDNSQVMIQLAKQSAIEHGVDIQFILADMQEIMGLGIDNFDMITCLGNSLALLPSLDALRHVIESVERMMALGGAFVFQVLNAEVVNRPDITPLPIRTGVTDSGERTIFVRFFDNSDIEKDHSVLVLCALFGMNGNWRTTLTTQKVLRLRTGLLSTYLYDAGLRCIEVYSDFKGSKFHPESDRDIVVAARRCD